MTQPLSPAPALRSSRETAVTLLRVHGEDAFSYLQSQVTADLRVAGEHWVRYALWLDAKGYVQADTFILRETADSFLLFSYDIPADQLEEIALANVIADDVEVESLGENYRHWALWSQNEAGASQETGGVPSGLGSQTGLGSKAELGSQNESAVSFLPEAVLPQAGCFAVVSGDTGETAASSCAEGDKAAVSCAEGDKAASSYAQDDKKATLPVLLFAGRNASGGNYDLLIPKNAPLPSFVSALDEVPWEQRQARRIADGIPAIPADIGAGDLPQEGGDLARLAVSTDKGCYLGQEVIARWHATLQVRSGLFRIRLLPAKTFEEDACVLPLRLYAGTKPVGELRSYALEAGVGLALLRLHRLGDARALGIEAGGEPVFKVLEPVLS